MLNIFQAKLQHLDDVSILFNQYRRSYGMSDNLEAANTFISERLAKNDSTIFLASVKHQSVGFMQIYPAFSSVAMHPTWILNDLFVDNTNRRQGVAKQMMHEMHKQAKKESIFSIKLSTSIDNAAAKALYRSMGYELNSDFNHFSKRII